MRREQVRFEAAGGAMIRAKRAVALSIAVVCLAGGMAIQACGSDDDATIGPSSADGGDGASNATSSSGASSGGASSGGGDLDGSALGRLDAIADTPAATPLCNTTGTFGCVAPIKCDPALGCVTCIGDQDCTGAEKFCVRGTCDECRTNADCPPTSPACYPKDHRCHKSCVGTSCPGNSSSCDIATGECVGCIDDTTCAGTNNPVCDPVTKQCVQCTTNAQCKDGTRFCHPTTLRCVACLTHTSCLPTDGGATQVCDPNRFRCRSGCLSNTDCGGTTPTCNLTTLSCACATKQDCASTPTTPTCGPNGQCVECVTGTDCPAGTGLTQCSTKNQCVQCLTDGQCSGTTPRCDTGTNTCVQCVGSGDCPPNKPNCNAGACVK
jgi:hypothetical protein